MSTFTIADVLNSKYDEKSGAVLIQVGSVVTKESESPDVEVWPTLGVAARAAKATAGVAACQALLVRAVDHYWAIGQRDIRRQQEILGNCGEGETILYAATGMGAVHCKADGSVTLYTSDTNTNDGRAVFLRISPTEFRFQAPWGYIVFDATGFHVYDHSGCALDMGGVGGIPAPFNTAAAICQITAPVIWADGSVMLGKGPLFMQAAITPSPVPTPIPLNPTGGSTEVAISVASP